MNPRNHLRREMPDQHRTVDGRNDSARRIRRHVVFRKQRKSVDPVRHHFEIIKFRQVFRDKKRGCGAVEKHHVAVFDQLDRRQGDFFFSRLFWCARKVKLGKKLLPSFISAPPKALQCLSARKRPRTKRPFRIKTKRKNRRASGFRKRKKERQNCRSFFHNM